MRITVLSLIVVFCAMISISVGATDHGHGRVGVNGSIVDTACNIATQDIDQTIDMGTIPVSQLINEGHSADISFSVQLENCTLNDIPNHSVWKDVRITINGEHIHTNLFSLRGEGGGNAELKIMNSNGVQISPGSVLPAEPITAGKMVFTYYMEIVPNHKLTHTGAFHAVLSYSMEYE